jgi:hypothetical protein
MTTSSEGANGNQPSREERVRDLERELYEIAAYLDELRQRPERLAMADLDKLAEMTHELSLAAQGAMGIRPRGSDLLRRMLRLIEEIGKK